MSELRADQIANRAGTGPVGLVGQSAAKALLRVDSAHNLSASFQISSVTSHGVGDVSATLSAAMAGGAFSAQAVQTLAGAGMCSINPVRFSVTSWAALTQNVAGAQLTSGVNGAMFGDLA